MKSKAKEVAARRLESSQRLLPVLQQKANDLIENAKRAYTAGLESEYFAIGLSKYLLERDTKAFRENLVRCVNLQIELCEAFERGEPVSASYVTWLNYKHVYYALAAGERDLARRMAGFLRTHKIGRSFQEHPFDRAMGAMVRASVLGDDPQKSETLTDFREMCARKGNADFQGYADFFERFLVRDLNGLNTALERIAQGHSRQGARGVFAHTLEAYICVWGVGAANFARLQGCDVECSSDLIPDDLLIR